jgi:hypothetical protein
MSETYHPISRDFFLIRPLLIGGTALSIGTAGEDRVRDPWLFSSALRGAIVVPGYVMDIGSFVSSGTFETRTRP